ncbi:MAG: protein YgfX [Thiobacillaceae bacterium]
MRNTEPARVIRIRPSRLQRLLLAGIALLASSAIALADLPPAGLLAAALFTAFITWQAWPRPAAVALRLNGDGSLEWRAAGQDWQPASLLPRTSVSPWLCVLAYRSQDNTHSLALYPDSLHPDDFRHLRVWLRWQARVEGYDRRKPKPQPFASTIEARLSRPRAHGEEGMKTSLPKMDV